ncbi:MAG: hypothetical protein HN916_08445 [Anaerolineae bacterium]|jgi:hypothetical protein|nr:hypothetical protein [Anaerolineae bacterium]MBT7991390.1 hypothetical protein [Anaerolineae bacterium]
MKLTKIASLIALYIGVMAIFAGGQVVLLNKAMSYHVIPWLPVYNLVFGLLTVFITTILLWRNSHFSLAAVLTSITSHSAVMIILQTSYRELVAPDSIRAMAIRLATWFIILILVAVQARKDKKSSD